MFKKIASILLAAIMVGSTAVVAASAAEADNAVAAADDSAVAAADDSAVAAADDSAVAAGDDSTVGAGNKVYFEVNPDLWKNFKTVTLYLYPHGDSALITWGSKKGNMTDEGCNICAFAEDPTQTSEAQRQAVKSWLEAREDAELKAMGELADLWYYVD